MADLRMNDNLNIVARSPLVIEKLGDDLNIIQKLDDEPNDVGGMTSAELKETFDRSGNLIKNFINDKLIPAVVASNATEVAREQAEAAREQAEAARKTAESEREQAESARKTAETEREQTEAGRKTAETAREQAESAREEHETIRVRQEKEREEAEKARVDSTTGIVARATTQADAAKAAAQSAAGDAVDAKASTESAAASEKAARDAAAASQSWATGGTGTRPDEETNNAKYWAGVAEKAAGGGVISFKGRTGAVHPESGDYTAEQVGAIPAEEKGAAGGVASLGADGKVPAGQLPAMDYAPKSHTHSASQINSGVLPIARGGTGQTTLTPAVETKGVRHIYAGTTDMTAGSSSLTTGCIYLCYE